MRILALSPHTDDIELGCGGYLSKLKEQGNDIYTMCFSYWYDNLYLANEHINSLETLGVINYVIIGNKRRIFNRQDILDTMIRYKNKFNPDLILCPSSTDIHQDHQVVHNEAVRAFSKDCSILGYELPWNCRGFNGNYFVELESKHLNQKIEMLKCYESQKDRPYFDFDFIKGWARTRGQQIKKTYAEAFEVITWIS